MLLKTLKNGVFLNEKYEHSINIENKPQAQKNITCLKINRLYKKMINGGGGSRPDR